MMGSSGERPVGRISKEVPDESAGEGEDGERMAET
jgi:hypothetical protein